MPRKPSRPGEIHRQIIEVMKRFPAGITGGQIREELERGGLKPGDQTHLDRRKRDLKKWFLIGKRIELQTTGGSSRRVTVYQYLGDRGHVTDEGDVSQRGRAQVNSLRAPDLGSNIWDTPEVFQERSDFRLGKSLTVGIELRQQWWQHLCEARENLSEFWERVSKGANPFEILAQL